MKCVYIDEAKYVADPVVFLRFNDGLSGQVKIANSHDEPVASKF